MTDEGMCHNSGQDGVVETWPIIFGASVPCELFFSQGEHRHFPSLLLSRGATKRGTLASCLVVHQFYFILSRGLTHLIFVPHESTNIKFHYSTFPSQHTSKVPRSREGQQALFDTITDSNNSFAHNCQSIVLELLPAYITRTQSIHLY